MELQIHLSQFPHFPQPWQSKHISPRLEGTAVPSFCWFLSKFKMWSALALFTLFLINWNRINTELHVIPPLGRSLCSLGKPITVHPVQSSCAANPPGPALLTQAYAHKPNSLLRTGDAPNKSIDPCIFQSSNTRFTSPFLNSTYIFLFQTCLQRGCQTLLRERQKSCFVWCIFKFSSIPSDTIQVGFTCRSLVKNA